MKNTTNLYNYLTDATSYINDLHTLAQEYDGFEPSDEFLTGDFWGNFVDQIVKDGMSVGKPGYLTYYEEECA